jgi:hypothetical protein
VEPQLRPVDAGVPVPQRGEAEGAVVAGVLLVADAHERALEQRDDEGGDPLPGQAGQLQVGLDPRA